jgi:hypothetical protein
MAFNTSILKKKKSHGMEEMEPKEKYETSEEMKSYSPKMKEEEYGTLKAKKVPLSPIGSIKSTPSSPIGSIKTMSEYGKKSKGESALKLDALIAAAAKKKLPVKASVEKEVEIEPKEKEMKAPKKPTEFVQHGGSLLQYLKKKK